MNKLIAFCIALLGAGVLGLLPVGKVYAPQGSVPQDEVPVRVLFVGDIMTDRNVARSIRSEGAETLLYGVKELLRQADVRVINWEGSITTNPSIAQVDNTVLRFTTPPILASEVMRAINPTVISLANNHAYDFGREGYLFTRSYLEEEQLPHFGHPYNAPGYLSTSIEVQRKILCFVGYHSLFDADTTDVIDEISRIRPSCWRLFVFPHWGEEYVHTPLSSQERMARAFIDAGADGVVGAHPHVVQTFENYNGKPIFYSLGNFLFDQNFSWATTHGAAVRLDLYEAKTVFTVTPIQVRDQHVGIALQEDRERILSLMGVVAEFTLP